jgi:hypothetical protein
METYLSHRDNRKGVSGQRPQPRDPQRIRPTERNWDLEKDRFQATERNPRAQGRKAER